MDLLPIAKGAATYLPLLYRATRGRTGGTGDPRYCYSVWMRHLVLLSRCGMSMPIRSAAELGPGDSLGIGLAALLSGADRLLALDVVEYASNDENQAVLSGLVELFRSRSDIPDDTEYPGVFPKLDDYRFPARLWAPADYQRNVADARVTAIRAALQGISGRVEIRYAVPWDSVPQQVRQPVHVVLSQAVLEHVADPAATYAALGRWVAPGGFSSHVIDFRSHRITSTWDGHLRYPEPVWRIVQGRRPYLLNRRSPAEHLQRLATAGFAIQRVARDRLQPTVSQHDLATPFREWSIEDRETGSLHVVARHCAQTTRSDIGSDDGC